MAIIHLLNLDTDMKTIKQAAKEYADTKAPVVVSGEVIANTITELDNIVDQLIEVKKECWHTTHFNAIMIIITIIKTKKEMLCQNK